MANTQDTNQALAGMTDEGLFERLATDVLRVADPLCAGLSHPGVNAQAKTKKAPVDGICFVRHASPAHLVLVHHTTTAAGSLERKWLLDPATVRKRGKAKTSPPPGDLIKSVGIVLEERIRTPDLRATLILTTNQEPGDKLMRDAKAAGFAHGIEVDIWSRSRLAHVLDGSPDGQWLRRTHLNIEQERLSGDLFREISKRSLRIEHPPDNPKAWITRKLDQELRSIRGPVTFVAGGSGSGKSIACYRLLGSHIESGGYGLVLPHEAVAKSASIEQAVFDALHQLHPALASNQNALSFCTPDAPLLIVVEDVNRSGQAQRLAEKIAKWALTPDEGSHPGSRLWRLLCPVWPQMLTSLADDIRKKLDPMVFVLEPMSSDEGRAAVTARASLAGRIVSDVTAGAISSALGHDPLLIALHDSDTAPDSHHVIGRFIDGALARAQSAGDSLAVELHSALLELATQMLFRLQLSPTWKEVSGYSLSADTLQGIRQLALREEVIRLQGHARDQVILFRHDRVRDWLLVEAAVQLDKENSLPDQLIAEPFLAEVIGAAIARRDAPPHLVARAHTLGPLTLFHALRTLPSEASAARRRIIDTTKQWLKESAKHPRRHRHLYWECLSALARTDDAEVIDIVQLVPGNHPTGMLARLHNGDIAGGAELCARFEPGTNALFRDAQIAHAKLRFGEVFVQGLASALRDGDFNDARLGGLLRLAGHVAEPNLGPAIQTRWLHDGDREERLADYLWAFARCCNRQNAEEYLAPICGIWAQLPEERDGSRPSPKDDLAAHNVDWAFARTPPVSALDYFLSRAKQEDLRWQITYMLRGVDHPKVFEFIAEEIARRKCISDENAYFFSHSLLSQWRDDFGSYRRHISDESRHHLLSIWRDCARDSRLREAAFDIWATRHGEGDTEILQEANLHESYRDHILQQRLKRGDTTAIPDLIEKIGDHNESFNWWWQYAKYVLCSQIIRAMDDALVWRGQVTSRTWDNHMEQDWEMQRLLMLIPQADSERLLVKHWEHLRYSSQFIQAAFFVCTPELVHLANEAVLESPQPAEVFRHLSINLGIKMHGHSGITRPEQILVLEPYLDLIDRHCLMTLSEECNDNGWFDLRRQLLDSRVNDRRYAWSSQGASEYFDSFLDNDHMHWIEHEIDDALKTGVTWNWIRDDLAFWYGRKSSTQALQLLAQAVAHLGSRSDLDLLKVHNGMPREAAKDIITDTVFSVRRRTI